MEHSDVTRSMDLTTSLHFAKLVDYRAAGNGTPVVRGQTATGVDNGYGLQGNPSLHALQDAVSVLENGTQTLLYPSGSTALNALEAFLCSGDNWLMPDSVYFPVRRYAEYLQEKFGIQFGLYDPADPTTLERAINDKTKLIHIETPSSVTFNVTNISAVVDIAHKRKIITSADNTWASGVLFKPLDHGVDMSVLSLTKYAAGYSDVFMGSITTNNADIYVQLARHHRVQGYTVSPFSATLVSRGLESLPVRLGAEGERAMQVVAALQGQAKIAHLYYVDPTFATDFSGPNSLLSVELDDVYTDDQIQTLFNGFKTFCIGESWGGTRSLVLPFQPSEFQTRFNPPQGTIIRFHTGLEDSAAQLADISSFCAALQLL